VRGATARKKPHIGANFESWLDDAGIREDVTGLAIKAVIARQLISEMKKTRIIRQIAELENQPRAGGPSARSGQWQCDDQELAAGGDVVGRKLRPQLV
jgi:hypothetical protein